MNTCMITHRTRREGYDCILSQVVVSRPCSTEKCSSGNEPSSSTTFTAALKLDMISICIVSYVQHRGRGERGGGWGEEGRRREEGGRENGRG